METMKEARGIGYEIPGLPGSVEHIRKQWGSLKYVDHLGFVTNTTVDGWRIDLFKNTTGGVLIDRKEINQLFFKFRESLPPEALNQPVIVDVERARAVAAVLKAVGLSARATIRTQENNLARDVRSTALRLSDLKKDLFIKSLTRKSLETFESEDMVYTMITRILKDGFYTLSSTQPTNGIEFLTRDLTLSHFNAAHAVNVVVPMGNYKVRLLIRNGYVTVMVLAGDKNPVYEEYCHPHLSGGSVCWGNLTEAYHLSSAKLELENLLSLTKDVLTTYNDDNPYAGLYKFFEAYKADNLTKNGVWPEEEPEHVEDELYPEDEEEPEGEYDDDGNPI